MSVLAWILTAMRVVVGDDDDDTGAGILGVGRFPPGPPRLEKDPEGWLECELVRLRKVLLDSQGSCRAHVVSPDGATYFDSRRAWSDRNWAIFRRLSKRDMSRLHLLGNPTVVGQWELVRTLSRPDKPTTAHHEQVLPIRRTITAAEKGARKRAREARKAFGKTEEIQQIIENLRQLGPAEWSRLFRYLPRGFPNDKVRKVMRELLIHHQNGKCPLCDRRLWHAVLDHDHYTDGVRGVLCAGCNGAEGGGIGWTAERKLRFKEYRLNPPAAAFGWLYGSGDSYADPYSDW